MAEDPGQIARAIIDASLYMVLATADEGGQPWASPVYFASSGYTEFFWVSAPQDHSILAKDGLPDHRIPARPD